MGAMILKGIFIAVITGVIVKYATKKVSFDKNKNNENQVEYTDHDLQGTKTISFANILAVASKLLKYLVICSFILVIISLPFIYTGLVGGIIIWTCIAILIRLL